MARRENQGLHIALIILVMLTVLLAVTTYLFSSRARSLAAQKNDIANQNSQLTQQREKAFNDAETIKGFLGYTPEVSIEDIEKNYTADMLTYGGSLAEVDRNYRELPKQMLRGIQDRNKRVSTLTDERKQLNDDLAQARKQFADQLAEARTALAKAEADLKRVSDTALQERNRINSEKAELARVKDETQGEYDQFRTESTSKIETLSTQVANQTQIIEDRNETIQKLTNENFETPDGKIRYVNARTNMVLVNLGGADGLRRQQTFNVYGADANNLAKETVKGKIEITRIINDHESEGRIIEDSVLDPILSGDFVYTAIWDSKSGLHFALVGEMDIDGDGRDDRRIIKNLISLNNGTVDAEDVEGEMNGRLSRNTKYLVTGETPSDAESAERARRVWTQMTNEADQLGIERISIQKLLGFIGYTG